MNAAARRRQDVQKAVMASDQPITASDLAARFNVSRQIIVQDIALLRASGVDIIATPNGYIHPQPQPLYATARRIFPCAHQGMERLREELTLIVYHGGKIIDVIIEHPVYGEYRGMLMIVNYDGIQSFIERLERYGAEPLSKLTGGVHLHTIEAVDDAALDRIGQALHEAGLLVEE